MRRRLISRREIFSPSYSAILFPRLKFLVAKHPRPSMLEALTSMPGMVAMTLIVASDALILLLIFVNAKTNIRGNRK